MSDFNFIHIKANHDTKKRYDDDNKLKPNRKLMIQIKKINLNFM